MNEQEIQKFHCGCMHKDLETRENEIRYEIDKLKELVLLSEESTRPKTGWNRLKELIGLSEPLADSKIRWDTFYIQLNTRQIIRDYIEIFYKAFVGENPCANLILQGLERCKGCELRQKYPQLIDYYIQQTLPIKYAKP